jgi:undecaprenyl-diphosphatase
MNQRLMEPLERMARWDGALALTFNRAACRAWVRAPFHVVSRLGDGIFWYALMLALLVRFREDAAPAVVHMVAAGLTCTVLYKWLKGRTLRPRPYESCPGLIRFAAPLDRFSFPSGHTLHAVAFTLVALEYYPTLAWLTVPFTLLVAISRVALGLHYPSDVVAGVALGAAVAALSFHIAGWGE